MNEPVRPHFGWLRRAAVAVLFLVLISATAFVLPDSPGPIGQAHAATKAQLRTWSTHSESNHEAESPPRVVFRGHTLADVANDPELLELVRRAADYIGGLGDTRIGPNGELNPPVSDGMSDTPCPAGEECP